MFTENPSYTLFSADYKEKEPYVGESYEVPFDQTNVYYDDSSSVLIPPKGDIIRRITVRSILPALYQPLGPGYVYPLYTDQVDGSVYVQNEVLALEPGDFIGYFNTQFLNAWATVFVGSANLSVSYDTTTNKFTFTSPTFANIYFHNDSSGVFWGFDPRSFDFLTSAGYKGYNFVNGTLTAPLSLVQSGWIRGFTPPPGVGFSYVDSVACRLIRSATLSIGGQTIDRLTAERLIIEDDLGVAYENQTGLAILEGKGESSQIYAPREYYTRLTFNIDTLNVNKLYRQDLRVDVDYEKFENLPQTLVTTKSLTDGGSYLNTNIKTLLGIGDDNYVYATNFYKKWIVYAIQRLPFSVTYYFYDTTKPIGDAASWVFWQDPSSLGVYAFPTRPYFVGGTMYTFGSSQPYLRSVPVADMISGTATATQGASFFPGLYEGQVALNTMTADARYVYIDVTSPIITFGSNTAYTYNFTPRGRTYLPDYGNQINLVYNVASISTTQLVASDNTALVNFVTTSSLGITQQYTPTSVTITNQTKVASTMVVTVKISYTQPNIQVLNLPGFYTTTSVPLSGSNVATFISCTPECAFANTSITYKVYNIATPQLIPSENTAVINYVTTFAVDFPGVTKTVTTTIQTKSFSNIFVTANVAYTYTSNGKPSPQVFELPFGYSSNDRHITVRYDTTKPINQWSSYDYLTFPGTGAPKTWYDITGVFSLSVAAMPLAFDGRNIYSSINGSSLFQKIDSQNFLNLSAYTYFNTATVPIPPNLTGIPGTSVPNATDGRYFYFQVAFSSGSAYLTRYDSNLSITDPTAYSALLFTNSNFPNGYGFYPFGFDGKSVYYIGGTYGTVRASILRYDTTTNTVSDWIIFDGNGKAETSQGTTVNTITWASPSVAVLSCLVSARYVYLTETWSGGFESFRDLVQFDPLVMTGTLESSVIVKYEKYTKSPETPTSLYGQTLLSEFTMIQGRVFDSFNLSVPASTREFWVTIDTPAVISRIVLRLNNEVLVDDDRVTTRYIRAFESHSTMPSSSNVSVYSFAVDPQKMSPSGTLNMSRIASPVLDVYLVTAVSTNVKVRFYAKTFNVLEIQNGLGGLLFNSGF
jgi:hypothetical protein